MHQHHDPGPVPEDRPDDFERAARRLLERLDGLDRFDLRYVVRRLATKYPAELTRVLDHIDDAKDRSSRRQ